MYSLSFYEAVEKCINGEGFIRGESFRDGVYVRKQGEKLVAVDAFNSNKVVGDLYVSTGIMSQRYKLLENIADEELVNGSGKLTVLYNRAI